MIGAGDVRVTDRIDRETRKVHRFAFQRPARVQAGQQQQVLDEARYPLRLRCHPAHRMRHRLAVVAHALGEFGVAADRGKRCAQFVTRVGDELPHPGLAGLARLQRGRDVVEHPVQRRPELAHLGRGVCVGFGHPHRQLDLAAGQWQRGNLARGLRDAAQRRQCSPDDDDPGDRRGGQRDTVTIPKMTSIRIIVASTLDIDRPVTIMSPPRRLGRRRHGSGRGHRDPGSPVCGSRRSPPIWACALSAQRGPGTAAGRCPGVDRLAVADHRRDHARRLTRRIEEPWAGPGRRIVGVLVVPPPGTVRFGIHQRRAVRGAAASCPSSCFTRWWFSAISVTA